MPVGIFWKPQEIQMRLRKPKKMAAPALLLFPGFCSCFFCRRRAETLFHSAGTGADYGNEDWVAVISEESQCYTDLIKVIRVRCKHQKTHITWNGT